MTLKCTLPCGCAKTLTELTGQFRCHGKSYGVLTTPAGLVLRSVDGLVDDVLDELTKDDRRSIVNASILRALTPIQAASREVQNPGAVVSCICRKWWEAPLPGGVGIFHCSGCGYVEVKSEAYGPRLTLVKPATVGGFWPAK